MPRVALVTGGTRGIGAAIAKALKAAGYKVAAVYDGNDEAAQKFKAETGINVYKWDVSSFEACAAGVKQVEADLGPVDVLVNNAGITRDAQLHRMKPEQWTEVINTNLGSLFNMTPAGDRGHARRANSAASSTSPRSTARRASSGRPTIPPPRPARSASPRRWRRRARASASPSTRLRRATSIPRWCRRCRRTCWRRASCRPFRSAGSASRKRSGAAWCFLLPTMPASSPARRSPRTAGNILLKHSGAAQPR